MNDTFDDKLIIQVSQLNDKCEINVFQTLQYKRPLIWMEIVLIFRYLYLTCHNN